MKRGLLILFMSLLAAGCSYLNEKEYEPEIVVEGWIEDGGFPVVIVTSTVQVTDQYKSWTDLQENIIRWAKVSVSDGEEEVVLTGKMNNDCFPPYI